MDSLFLYVFSFSLLLLSLIKDKQKTKKALLKSYKSFMKLLPSVIPMMLFIGISMTIINPNLITKLLGYNSGVFGVSIGLILGSITLLPGFVAFPLGANLLKHGAGYPQIAGFISSLMAVGIVTFPVEIKYFDKKTAIIRNSLGLIASIVFVLIVWGVMK